MAVVPLLHSHVLLRLPALSSSLPYLGEFKRFDFVLLCAVLHCAILCYIVLYCVILCYIVFV